MTAPFGIALGSTPNASNAVYTVVFTSIPRFHPKFPVVMGRWTHETGLCELTGFSRWYEAGPYSFGICSEYENIKAQLQNIYGEYYEENECYSTLACIDRYENETLPTWTEIIVRATWREDTGSNLPEDLDHIVLMIESLSEIESRIRLTYGSIRQEVPFQDVL